jgi:hypothetical protein
MGERIMADAAGVIRNCSACFDSFNRRREEGKQKEGRASSRTFLSSLLLLKKPWPADT